MKHLELDESVLLLPGNIKAAAAAAWKLCLDWRGWNVWASRDSEPGARSAAEGRAQNTADNQVQRGQWGAWQLPPGAWGCSASLSALVGEPHAAEVSFHKHTALSSSWSQGWRGCWGRALVPPHWQHPGNDRVPHPREWQGATSHLCSSADRPRGHSQARPSALKGLIRAGCGLTQGRRGYTQAGVGTRAQELPRHSGAPIHSQPWKKKQKWKVGHKMSWPGLMGPEQPRVVSAVLAHGRRGLIGASYLQDSFLPKPFYDSVESMELNGDREMQTKAKCAQSWEAASAAVCQLHRYETATSTPRRKFPKRPFFSAIPQLADLTQ